MGNNRILVVEDNDDLRVSLVRYLTIKGFEVIGVSTGLEFYSILAKEVFNLVIIDIGLPDQNGYVLAEYVSKNTNMGIIIMTANGEAEDRLQGYQAGADNYLTKPVNLSEILYAIKNLLKRIGGTSLEESIKHCKSPWKLLLELWSLEAPTGEIIPLTAKEMKFIECIALASGKPVSRDKLFNTLSYEMNAYNSRAMDALVRRLRRKLESYNINPVPIKTAYTSGYCFSSPIIVV